MKFFVGFCLAHYASVREHHKNIPLSFSRLRNLSAPAGSRNNDFTPYVSWQAPSDQLNARDALAEFLVRRSLLTRADEVIE
jgi:hypothetical protein